MKLSMELGTDRGRVHLTVDDEDGLGSGFGASDVWVGN